MHAICTIVQVPCLATIACPRGEGVGAGRPGKMERARNVAPGGKVMRQAGAVVVLVDLAEAAIVVVEPAKMGA